MALGRHNGQQHDVWGVSQEYARVSNKAFRQEGRGNKYALYDSSKTWLETCQNPQEQEHQKMLKQSPRNHCQWRSPTYMLALTVDQPQGESASKNALSPEEADTIQPR